MSEPPKGSMGCVRQSRRASRRVVIWLSDDLLAALDDWAQAQTGEKPSPSGAVRLILTKFLQSKGHSRRDQVHGLEQQSGEGRRLPRRR
jgi:hypothetical protein